MRIKIKIGFFAIIFSLLCFFVYSIINKIREKEELSIHLQQIPSFEIKTIDGAYFTEKDLLGKNTIIMYYSINCNFCEAEAIQIQKNKNRLNQNNLLMVSADTKDEILKFRKEYDLNENNIFFVIDIDNLFASEFGIKGTPIIMIYNKDGGLLKRFNGSVHFDKIIGVLNN